jgi:streptogramin lyase
VQPSSIVAGPDGSMWFTGGRSSRIWRITPAGQITSYGGLPTDAEPDAVATAPDGNLWFTVRLSNKIWRITPAGLITSYGGLPANARRSAMIAGPDGNLWFTEDNRINNRIWRITRAGQITSYSGLPSDAVPGRLTPGPDGNLWVVYLENNVTMVSPNRIMGNHTLARITPAGAITVYRLPGPDLGSLTAGPDGTLWFTAEHDDWYYPGPARIGRITIARLGGGHALTSPQPTSMPRATSTRSRGEALRVDHPRT